MKGFYIEVTNDLLDPKHREKMGESVWLFMWLLDKITTVTLKKGNVSGGKPIKFLDIKRDLGISRSTYMRWMDTLERGGYISTIRTPYGKSIVVLKAKKRFNRSVDESKVEHLITSVKKGTSPLPKNETSPSLEMEHLCTGSDTSLSRNGTSNIRQYQLDSTIDKINTFDAGASGPLKNDSNNFLTNKPPGEKKDPPGGKTNETIALFLKILPGDFVGAKTAFAKLPTREAVEELLKRYSSEEIENMIQKYDDGKADQYRPHVGTVYEFCTTKLAKVEAYVSKSASSGLHAHRPISTPEQAKVRDEQWQRKMDLILEKVRETKGEWVKNHPA